MGDIEELISLLGVLLVAGVVVTVGLGILRRKESAGGNGGPYNSPKLPSYPSDRQQPITGPPAFRTGSNAGALANAFLNGFLFGSAQAAKAEPSEHSSGFGRIAHKTVRTGTAGGLAYESGPAAVGSFLGGAPLAFGGGLIQGLGSTLDSVGGLPAVRQVGRGFERIGRGIEGGAETVWHKVTSWL